MPKQPNSYEEEDVPPGSYLDLDLEAEDSITSGGEGTNDQLPNPSARSSPPSPSSSSSISSISYDDTSQTPLSYHLARDRDRRAVRPPRSFDDEDYFVEALYTTEDGGEVEPEDYREATRSVNWEDWKAANAMDEEMSSQAKNHTWTVVKMPENQRVIGSRWIYKYKLGIPGVE